MTDILAGSDIPNQ